MADLDDDIARIAALRGRPVEEVRQTAERIDRERRRVSDSEIRDLFDVPDGRSEVDLDIFDKLPAELRVAIYDCPLMVSASKARVLYERTGHAGCIADGIRDQLPAMLKRYARQHYGKEHPAAKETSDV